MAFQYFCLHFSCTQKNGIKFYAQFLNMKDILVKTTPAQPLEIRQQKQLDQQTKIKQKMRVNEEEKILEIKFISN